MVSAALLSRRALPMAARQMRGVRHAHFENTFDTIVPFRVGPKHKKGLFLGIFTFCAVGFSLPFVAVRYQLTKGGA